MKTRSEWETLGGRLNWAIKRQPPKGRRKGIGLLISKLEEAEVSGANYPSIQSYKEDRVVPPIPFLEAAADALGVRVEWLAFGKGAPNEEEERARLAAAADDRLLWHELQEAIPDLMELDPTVTGALWGLTVRMTQVADRLGIALPADPTETTVKVAMDLWVLIIEPFSVLGERANKQLRLDPRTVSLYAMAAIHALTLALEAAAPPGLTPDELDRLTELEEAPDAEEA